MFVVQLSAYPFRRWTHCWKRLTITKIFSRIKVAINALLNKKPKHPIKSGQETNLFWFFYSVIQNYLSSKIHIEPLGQCNEGTNAVRLSPSTYSMTRLRFWWMCLVSLESITARITSSCPVMSCECCVYRKSNLFSHRGPREKRCPIVRTKWGHSGWIVHKAQWRATQSAS